MQPTSPNRKNKIRREQPHENAEIRKTWILPQSSLPCQNHLETCNGTTHTRSTTITNSTTVSCLPFDDVQINSKLLPISIMPTSSTTPLPPPPLQVTPYNPNNKTREEKHFFNSHKCTKAPTKLIDLPPPPSRLSTFKTILTVSTTTITMNVPHHPIWWATAFGNLEIPAQCWNLIFYNFNRTSLEVYNHPKNLHLAVRP